MEEIAVQPALSTFSAGGTVGVLMLIRKNPSRLPGYFLDMKFIPESGLARLIAADVPATKLLDIRGLITAAT